jgi:hypothetical protein
MLSSFFGLFDGHEKKCFLTLTPDQVGRRSFYRRPGDYFVFQSATMKFSTIPSFRYQGRLGRVDLFIKIVFKGKNKVSV